MKKSSDWLIALGVLVCSIVLLGALAIALMGNPFATAGRTLRARFADITGIQVSSIVKLAGANAGTVVRVRVLSPEERLTSGNPADAVEITVAISDRIPPITEGTVASVSADTLLADKFVHLSAGDAAAPVLANGAIIPGTSPVPIDLLVRNLDQIVVGLNGLLATAPGGSPDLLANLGSLVTDARSTLSRVDELLRTAGLTVTGADALLANAGKTLTGADSVLADADTLIDNAGKTIANADNVISGDEQSLRLLVVELDEAADKLAALATRADRLLADSADDLNASIADARIAIRDLRVASAFTKTFTQSLVQRPQQLIWGPGRRPPTPPTEEAILASPNALPLQ